MNSKMQTAEVRELTDADLDHVTGGGLLHVIRVFVMGGTSSAPGGTSTDSGPTATNPQIWVTYAS